MASVQRGSVLVGMSEHDEYRVLSPEDLGRCGHRLLSVVPIVSIRVEGGYAARCLLCGTTGPVRGNGASARDVLLKQMVRDEE
jgi:hypothetical protein